MNGYINECQWFPVCPMKRYYELGCLEKKWIDSFCRGDWKSCVRYKMEEEGHCHPDWVLPDGSMDNHLKQF